MPFQIHDVHLPHSRWNYSEIGLREKECSLERYQGTWLYSISLIEVEQSPLGAETWGPGTRHLKLQSKALRLQWLWRYSKEPPAYWSKVIKEKYGDEDMMTIEDLTPYGVSLWRSIKVLWPFLKNHTVIKAGDSYKTSFWEDKWLGSDSLKGCFL